MDAWIKIFYKTVLDGVYGSGCKGFFKTKDGKLSIATTIYFDNLPGWIPAQDFIDRKHAQDFINRKHREKLNV